MTRQPVLCLSPEPFQTTEGPACMARGCILGLLPWEVLVCSATTSPSTVHSVLQHCFNPQSPRCGDGLLLLALPWCGLAPCVCSPPSALLTRAATGCVRHCCGPGGTGVRAVPQPLPYRCTTWSRLPDASGTYKTLNTAGHVCRGPWALRLCGKTRGTDWFPLLAASVLLLTLYFSKQPAESAFINVHQTWKSVDRNPLQPHQSLMRRGPRVMRTTLD